MNKKDELQAQRNELLAHSEDTLDRIKELDKEIKAVIDKEAEPKLKKDGDYSFDPTNDYFHILLGGEVYNHSGTKNPVGYSPRLYPRLGNIYDDLANRDKKIDGFKMEKAGHDLDVSLLLNGIIMIREVQSGDDIFFEPKELAEFIAQCQQVLNGLKN